MRNKTRYKLLQELFAEANSQGLEKNDPKYENFRSETVPDLCGGKRLSQCNERDIEKVIAWLKDRGRTYQRQEVRTLEDYYRKQYPSNKNGMQEEIRDLAKIRFGSDYIVPLNNLCARFGESDGYRKMKIAGLKELKRRLIELQRDEPW